MRHYIFLILLFAAVFSCTFCAAQSGYIYTFAGNGTGGYAGDGGPATAAELNNPSDVFEDGSGNFYIADRDNQRVRKINTAGIITTVAGIGTTGYTGDGGPATAAKLRHPNSVCVDVAGNIYIADEDNQVIRKINTAGIINTVAGNGTSGFSGDGGAATTAELSDPEAVAVDAAGNIYIADNNNNRIRIVNTSGIISTFAGGGATGFTTDGTPATAALLCNMRDVSVDNSGNVYFTNQGCYHILRVTAGLLYDEAGAVTAAYTGDCGPADSADISGPYGVYPDNLGNVYLCPRGNLRVRKVNTLDYITTVAGDGVAGYTGDGGLALDATVSSTITGIYADMLGNVYFADAGNNVIRNFTSSDYSDTVTIPICAGGTDTLHDTTGYGVWTSSNTGVAIVGSGSGIVTGVTSGTSIITFTNVACPELFLVAITEPVISGASVCVGSTVTLTDTSSSGGVWSSGATTIATIGSGTGIVHGVSSGTAVITYTVGHCYSIATVTINAQPSVIMGSAMSMCAGDSIMLSDTASGGVWASANTSVATMESDGTVTGIAVGTATISYSIAGCYAAQVVTVNTQPVAITGNTPICQTLSINLLDATGGGTWSSLSTAVATITGTGLVTGVTVDTTTVSYVIGNCFVTTVVTVNTQPSAITLASGIAYMCEGSSISLTDAIMGGAWSSSNTAVATVGTDGTVASTGTGIGTSTITYIIGSCYVTQEVTVYAQPVAITGDTASVCQTFSITLSDAISGGVWSSGTTTVATVSAGGVVTGAGVGTAVITYDIGSCYVTAVVTVNTQPVDITITGGGAASVCGSSSISLTDATAGGTWSSLNTAVATVGTDGTVMSAGTGTSTIIYSIGSCSVSQVVTVNPQPVAITGNTAPICETFTLGLTDATAGGVWSSGTTTIATITAGGVVTGTGVGTAIITYAIGSCYVTAIVTVNTQPVAITATGGASMCDGSAVSLTDATTGGLWSSANTAIATVGTDGTVTGVGVGTATIIYIIGNCSVSEVVTVNTQPAAITGNTGPVCQTFTLPLTDATGGGIWSSGTTSVGTISASGVVTGIGVGTTVITYTIGTCYVTTVVTVNLQPAIISGNPAICNSYTTSLSDVSGGGLWSSSNTFIAAVAGGVVTGNAVGTATITYTIGACYVTEEVTVNTQPVAITGNTGPICQTFTVTLTDATAGGLWSSISTTIGTIGSTSGVVTGIGVGATVISYAIANCAVTTIVTVDAQPAPISGDPAVCQGLTTSLSDVTGGGIWSSVNTTVGTVSATGLVSGNTTGTTTISYTLGICAAKVIVTVNPLPGAINGVKTVCSGSATNLTDASGGGTWSSSNTAVATIVLITGVVTGQTVAAASTATITYTLATGCIITTVVTVYPLPAAISGPDAVCFGSTVTLSDATGAGTWSSSNGNATIGSSTGIVTGSNVGVSAITYKLPTGCYVTAPMTVNPLPNAITGLSLVCVGSAITLSDVTGGGAWASSNTSLATVGSATGIVSGIAVGVVTITYTLGTGCYATYAVTVNTPLAVITPVGDTVFCPGGFVALTANTGAGLNYQWYIGGVAIPGALSSSYIATLAGSYQVLVTNASGCTALSIPMSVTIDTPVAVVTASGSTTICAGASITLNANIGIGLSYQWLLGGVAITGAVGSSYTTTIAGSYAVVVTNSVGCSAIAAATIVSLNPSPTANITLSGPLTFCQGDSVVMATGYVTGYTYQWYNASGAMTGANGQSYTATATGNYYVIVTNSYGCTATSIVVSVVANPLPDVAITASGSTIFCSGGSVTLGVAAAAGNTYQWYNDGALITGATNTSYLATVGGGYQVQVTDPATGCTAETLADTTVTVVGTPLVIPITPASFCWGGSSLLSTSLSGASGTVTYQWYFNGTAITGATGPTYNATIPGNYSCQIAIPGSCTAATLAIPVTEYPLPDPVVTLDEGNLMTGTFYVTYQWYKNLVAIPGATAYSTLCAGSGDYKVAVTDTNGCQSYSDVYVDTSCNSGNTTTAIPNVSKENISIYPNPATNELTITITGFVILSGAEGFIITNNLGQEIIAQPITGTQTTVNIAILPAGLYYITFRGDNGTTVQKFVKM